MRILMRDDWVPAKILFLKTQIQFMYQPPCRISFFHSSEMRIWYPIQCWPPKDIIEMVHDLVVCSSILWFRSETVHAPVAFPVYQAPARSQADFEVPGRQPLQGLLGIFNLKSILKGIKITDTFNIDCVSWNGTV